MRDFGPLAWQRKNRRVLRLCLPAFFAAVLLLPPGSGLARDTLVVGGSAGPEVIVDLEAIEFPAGRMENFISIETFRGKGLLMPGSKVAPGERIVLVPPGSRPAAKTLKLKPPRSGKAKSGAPRLKLNIPETPSAKPVMPKPAKAKQPVPPAPAKMAATPPEPPPMPEPPAKAELKKKAKKVSPPAPRKETKLAAKAEKPPREKVMPEPPAAPPPPPPVAPPPPPPKVEMRPEPKAAAKETAMKVPEAAKPEPIAPPPPPPVAAPHMAATDDGGLVPPPLPDLPNLPPPPPAANLNPPPLPERTVEKAAVTPPPPAKEQAKSGGAAEPVPMREPVLPQPRESAAPEESTQVAALPPPSTPIPASGPMTVLFSPGSAVLNGEASERIATVLKKMTTDKLLRLQLVAFATSSDDNPSRARRLSLSRALAVRSYLVEKGVKSTRMDVRALGNKFDKAPGDRVDLVFLP